MTARQLATLLFSTTFLLAGCSSGGGSSDAYPVDVSGARVSSRTMENGDLLEEYRVAGQLRMVRVKPARGAPYYLYDRDGDGRMDNPRDQVPVVYWKLYSW
ncbi:DUF2782 domain-containing protein [Stenotrophomonas sp. W1S232]|uniref:DUF2782 domain-containing protein n=1 Tax=Stenotrophomonas koreensis TaxID=266128 RepID=A0A0R0BN56_9GAMM|nr:DUF2782 domain-containing protein [Stenotrophomonas koreensis]KRG58685.1 hypothetical protein ABB25_05865 [Stenotrophomonas koreensis]MBB1117312.1 DUF2782 domain-containing protein [Stenotrophomonas koreensis]